MSTFKGNVVEFPDIRIDYFRTSPSDSKSRPPLAYFLSHVHSDHLVGLESCKSSFIYCSPATRDILLRLEKYPHRMNFAKGILETRKQTYRHLKNLLKAIPLETPTVIELTPGNAIRVTLFNANHCVGAVMFLIEGNDKAVLYTGDIRSELWWVNALTRHPILLPYVVTTNPGPQYHPESTIPGIGISAVRPSQREKTDQPEVSSQTEVESLKRLDNVYLDTTFVVSGCEDPYRNFSSKRDGLEELLKHVAAYPDDTIFYFDAWTFGYEDVWEALSNFLGSRIHVDDYRYGLYRALINGAEPKAPEGVKMMGFFCGNHFQEGCLTNGESRIHSCERGTGCDIWNKDFVRIMPIVSRHGGVEMAELGAGGGQGDLNQQKELEVGDSQLVGQLIGLCATKLQGQPQLLSSVLQLLTAVIKDGVQSITLDDFNLRAGSGKSVSEDESARDLDELPLDKLVPILAKIVAKKKQKMAQITNIGKGRQKLARPKRADGLPRQITFPYSRHSSYSELCHLIAAFKPRNIHPCTVDEANWTPASSMSSLFGHIYSLPQSFQHDQTMLQKTSFGARVNAGDSRPGSNGSSFSKYVTPQANISTLKTEPMKPARLDGSIPTVVRAPSKGEHGGNSSSSSKKRKRLLNVRRDHYSPPLRLDHYSPPRDRVTQNCGRLAPPLLRREDMRAAFNEGSVDEVRSCREIQERRAPSQISLDQSPVPTTPTRERLAFRKTVYGAILGSEGNEWSDISLVSVDGHQFREEEL